jgi:hypothetical protein
VDDRVRPLRRRPLGLPAGQRDEVDGLGRDPVRPRVGPDEPVIKTRIVMRIFDAPARRVKWR